MANYVLGFLNDVSLLHFSTSLVSNYCGDSRHFNTTFDPTFRLIKNVTIIITKNQNQFGFSDISL